MASTTSSSASLPSPKRTVSSRSERAAPWCRAASPRTEAARSVIVP
ncbi:hypothetical protein [Streptacidiphilus sp. PAMC 29251]